ncbi:MAG: TauD/TfdA family dioxygenase [Deltaproteobacteria bacterium]|nr:TauD/TfdA family dioxygenase [Deltaproteobacteria bacterium]MBI3294682.1 TauD/TfdA family dioxygenase [Deltaproteobacteria bacterium]
MAFIQNAEVSQRSSLPFAVVAASSARRFDIPPLEVISLFESQGAILFRGFQIEPSRLLSITDVFTESYSRDTMRRPNRFGAQFIRSVDPWTKQVDLHSEGSFTPAWPEVIWFCCVQPAGGKGGETILCDGAELWKQLTAQAKNYFLEHPIRYDARVPFTQNTPGRGRRPWLFNSPGTCNAWLDFDSSVTEFTQIRSAVTEGRQNGMICFANHLIIDAADEPQLLRRSLVDGTAIAEEFTDQIRKTSAQLTFEHKWQKGDLLMLDNRRFLHGRRAFDPKDQRDVVVVQTARAAFGYGVTTRVGLKQPSSAG